MHEQLATILADTGQFCVYNNSKQKEVEDWMKAHKVEATSKQLQQSLHLRSIRHGFEIEFQNGQFFTFFAYFRTQKLGCYEFPLKFGVNKGWTIKGAVMYLGEPMTKSNREVEIIYPHLGLGLVFLGGWTNENSQIKYAYLYEPQDIRCCGACGKKFQKSSNTDGKLFRKARGVSSCKCGMVSYCSDECEKKHYGQHLIFCEEGEL